MQVREKCFTILEVAIMRGVINSFESMLTLMEVMVTILTLHSIRDFQL